MLRFHATYAGEKAVIAIADGTILQGGVPTITVVEPLAERWVRLTFGDGAVPEVDLAELLAAGGVFAAIRDDRKILEAVTVDRDYGTMAWPADVDLDPDVLRGDEAPTSGRALPRRVIQPA